MANSKITALHSATTPLAGTEVLPVVQGGVTDQVSVANLTAGRTVSASGLLIGATTARAFDSATATITPSIQNEGVTANTSSASLMRNTASNAGPVLFLGKSRSGALGGVTIVQDGDQLGQVIFEGTDGTNLIEGALIRVEVDGTPGTNDMPGRLVLSTTAAGASTPTTRVTIASTGLVTLASTSGLSIGRTAVTSPATTDGNVFSGTYTPTLTNVTNLDSTTAAACQYMRVGNTVTVSGAVAIDPTIVGNTVFRMSLPIASALTLGTQLGGTFAAASTTTTQSGSIGADAATDTANFQLFSAVTTNLTYYFQFTYRVI